MAIFLGIDTGGTYTDAVLFDDAKGPLRAAKALTTRHDLALGVGAAIDQVLGDDAPAVELVSLSTTLATNAIVQGQGSPVCLILIGHDPVVLDRARLRSALAGDPAVFVGGGHAPSGEAQATLDIEAARAAILRHAPEVAAFAVAGYFAVRNPAHELAVRDLIRDLVAHPVTCAHELASALDAPRRAVTAVLNARLIPLLDQLVRAVRGLLAARDIAAPLMVVKGDGSLITADLALERPVETILSGPAASIVGARHLAAAGDAVVVDMGGTTTDIAVLDGGRPRLDRKGATVGGWRTMVEAVAVHSLGLGGDSEIGRDGEGALTLGPRRVMPLSLLAHQYPETLAVLETQAARGKLRHHDGRFAVRLRALDDDHAGLTAADVALWRAIEARPVALETLFMGLHRERSLNRLLARGLAIVAAFSPSDAAHVLGLHDAWSAAAARLGAALFDRDAEAEALARTVVDLVTHVSARAVVEAALTEDGLPAAAAATGLGRRLFDRALAGGGNLLDLSVKLARPLIAIGAPAATYHPAVAARLGAGFVNPRFAAAANAVGAVAGGVSQRVTALITAPDETRFRVHLASGVNDFGNLDGAAAFAADEAARLARARAEVAGAERIEIAVRRDDTIVDGPAGARIFIETRVVATATGRPRLAMG